MAASYLREDRLGGGIEEGPVDRLGAVHRDGIHVDPGSDLFQTGHLGVNLTGQLGLGPCRPCRFLQSFAVGLLEKVEAAVHRVRQRLGPAHPVAAGVATQ